MVFVSGTRLHLRSWRFFLPFILHTQRAARQARGAEGNLHMDLYRDRQFGFWTRTLWRDEAAMRAFMMSGAHAKAMRRHLNWADESYVVHWTQESSDVPSWAEVSRRMKVEGRATRLRHPSHAHERFEVPELH
jgi:quinol monooxygenase YgiN